MRADDAIALDAARRLSAFVKAAEARAMEMGFEREQTRFGNDGPAYFPFLRQLPELLADHERRAMEGARGPIPPHGTDPAVTGRRADPRPGRDRPSPDGALRQQRRWFSPGAGAGRGGRRGRRTAAGRDRDRHAIDPHRDLRARDVDRSPRPSRLGAGVRRLDGHFQDAAVHGTAVPGQGRHALTQGSGAVNA